MRDFCGQASVVVARPSVTARFEVPAAHPHLPHIWHAAFTQGEGGGSRAGAGLGNVFGPAQIPRRGEAW